MTYPVTALPVSEVNLWEYFDLKFAYRQKRPYNLSLPYNRNISWLTSQIDYPRGFRLPQSMWQYIDYSYASNQAFTLAYDRLLSQISDRASMGENFGQLGESAKLIVDKALIVAKSIRALRKLDLTAFTHWVNKGFVKRNTKFAAQVTLELNFAIIPSINDIYSAVNILQANPSPKPVRASAKCPFFYNNINNTSGIQTLYEGTCFAKYGANVYVDNPNLALANQLGLINPVQIAWQLLPGSFLIDWFIPVEQFLGHGTDLLGLRLEFPYSTLFVQVPRYWDNHFRNDFSATAQGFAIERKDSIVLPSLAFRPLKVPSWKRAANAVSLAIQAFYK